MRIYKARENGNSGYVHAHTRTKQFSKFIQGIN